MYSNPFSYRQLSEQNSPLGESSKKIKVFGEGFLLAPPEQATITLGVITENPNLKDAQFENSNNMRQIIDSLIAHNIPNEKIKTVVYRIEPQYNYENGKQIFRGFLVNHQIQVTMDNIQDIGVIIDDAVSKGGNFVSNIQFTVKQPNAYYNHALTLAINNGHQKALTIAKELGVKLNPIPTLIIENTQPNYPTPLVMSFSAKSEATPIQQGEINILANVEMEYSYF